MLRRPFKICLTNCYNALKPRIVKTVSGTSVKAGRRLLCTKPDLPPEAPKRSFQGSVSSIVKLASSWLGNVRNAIHSSIQLISWPSVIAALGAGAAGLAILNEMKKQKDKSMYTITLLRCQYEVFMVFCIQSLAIVARMAFL